MNTIIGTIHVPGGERRQGYETAAWYRTFEFEDQTVEVSIRGNFAHYTLQGRYTYEYLPTLLGGRPTGGGRVGEIDEPGEYFVMFYDYQAAEDVENGVITLYDGFEIWESFFDHPVSCRGYTTEYQDGKATYVPCEHEFHEDAHYRPTVTDRNSRGFLPFGYAPGVKNRKRHIKIVEAVS